MVSLGAWRLSYLKRQYSIGWCKTVLFFRGVGIGAGTLTTLFIRWFGGCKVYLHYSFRVLGALCM